MTQPATPSLSEAGQRIIAGIPPEVYRLHVEGSAVTLPATVFRQLAEGAACWSALMSSPHVGDLVDEWAEWNSRRRFRETSSSVSAAEDWRRVAQAPSWRELARRRAEPGQLHKRLVARRGEYWGGPTCWTTGEPRAGRRIA